MDLISREAVLDRIDKYIDKAQSTGTKDDFISFAELGVKALPSAFEGMTNGDVLKAIFPDCIDYHGIIEVKTHLDMGKTFRRSWWDSPYKGQDGLI